MHLCQFWQEVNTFLYVLITFFCSCRALKAPIAAWSPASDLAGVLGSQYPEISSGEGSTLLSGSSAF